MAVRIDTAGEVVTAYLSGEIDHHTAKEMRETIDEAVELNMPTLLVLDFSDVSFMDSSGIGLVMGRYKLMKNLSGKVFVENAPRQIKKVLRMAGIEKMLSEKSGKEVLV